MKKLVFAILGAGLLAGCCSTCCKDCAPVAWGETKFGEKASFYTIKGADGLTMVVSDFGARVIKCLAPDKNGVMADVTLGWNTIPEYEQNGYCMGMLVGRFGNRIKDGTFTLDGKTYQLAINEDAPAPRHCNLHAGPVGWDAKVWKVADRAKNAITFALTSPDGDMGFPGKVDVTVRYEILPKNIWRITYDAMTDKPTVINPTQHTYWNLAGEASGNVLDQELKICADKYTQTDAGLIPTHDAPVDGTGFDFRTRRPIGAKADWMKSQPSLKCTDYWYDHNFVLNGKMGELHQAVEMFDPKSGRALEIWTTEPCMQMYGAQNFTDKYLAKEKGKRLCPFAGIALETQHYPDSPNHPEFPSTVLRPGTPFHSVTEYRFTAR